MTMTTAPAPYLNRMDTVSALQFRFRFRLRSSFRFQCAWREVRGGSQGAGGGTREARCWRLHFQSGNQLAG